jgi:ABC-2 type transport system permease protein
MPIWTIAKKETRLLLRDPRSIVILLAMPFLFIIVLGLALGEGFGQKPDDRLRVSLVDLDQGYVDPEAKDKFPGQPWAQIVQRDLAETGGIRVEIIPTLEEAEKLISKSKRSAILVFGPKFSKRVHQCSFLVEGINPFYRDGVELEALDARLLRDETQQTAASIIEQVAQVSMLRVILPWMIGRAFEKLGDPSFMTLLRKKVPGADALPEFIKKGLASGIQAALKDLFPKYNLTGKTWAALTKSKPRTGGGAEATVYSEEGLGLTKRGAVRYQILVPSYTVMFAFFLVLTVGWLFASERRQGTIKRLRAAPLSRPQILLGKFLPCFALSLAQGAFLLAAGKAVFGMRWGPETQDWPLWRQILWLAPVVFMTSWAAMGMAMFIASLARTEAQVAIYGTPIVLVMAGISGCLMPRDLMPELMQQISLVTPHAWALDAYMQLLVTGEPNLARVGEACLALGGFGIGFLGLAWWSLRLD